VKEATLPALLVDFARAESARLDVPGTAIGVLHGDTMYSGAVGITNVEHPLPVTHETLFQIGSTSKTVTATALMQLVDEGRVDLEATVRTYLPDFRLQSETDAARIVVRDLLTHHTGYVGDYFKDTGRGDDAIAKIVAKMANSPQLVPCGTAFSYSNAAFYVVARIVEVLRGKPFEHVVRERIFAPLGMEQSFYFPEDCLTFRVVAGHIVTADGPRLARRWHMNRASAGGGGVISTVVDQLRYAAFHVGVLDAPTVLPRHAIAHMQTLQRPAGSMCESIGLSWMIDDAGDGTPLVKHGGATNGQLSAFEMIPAHRFAVTVLTNADLGRETRQTIADACQEHFLGFGKPMPRALEQPPADLAQYAGRYEATLEHLTVTVSGGGLTIEGRPPPKYVTEPRPRAIPAPVAHLAFTGDDRAAVQDGPRRGERVEFLRDGAGRIEWLRWDGRLARRV
jgi:CubicO group peptidase (beta-lactamase class C family)